MPPNKPGPNKYSYVCVEFTLAGLADVFQTEFFSDFRVLCTAALPFPSSFELLDRY